MDSPPADGGTVLRRHDGELLRRLTTLRSDESFHFVFSNRTHSDPYAVSLHTELTKRGLRVWQQRMNIPKDSDNWFSEWYPTAAQARKIICFLTAAYMKSPFCMKEWRVAESKHKLLVVVLEPMEQLRGVNPAEYPHASNALAYLDGGGQVIFHDTDDVVLEILKFTDSGAELMPGLAMADECEPEPALALGGLGSPPRGTGPQRGGAAAATAATAVKTDETVEALLSSVGLATYVAFFVEEGYLYVSDLLDAAEEDIDELVAGSKMKKPEQKRFRKVLASAAAAGGGGAKPGARDEAAEAGDSSKGEESLFKTMADAPDAPAAPVLIANAPSCITLQWSIPASNGAPITSYTVERRLKGSMDWTVAVADTPSNECQVPKSDAAETVFFRVCAINSGGTSDFGDASKEIACEKAARKLLLMVSSDDGLLSAGVSRKVTLEVGSMAEMTDALQRKLAIVEPLQVFLGEGSAAQPCTSLEQLPDKAKVLVRAIRVAAPASAPSSNDGKRNFKLLVTSPLFAENKKISCSAGSAEELTQTLKQMLNLTRPIGVVIYDKDFDEYRLIADLDDLESDKERVQVMPI